MAKTKLILILPIIILVVITNLLIFPILRKINIEEGSQDQKIRKILEISPKPNSEKLDKPTYIISYIGDIDGDVSEDWFFFFNLITTFYQENKIPGTFSFYPTSISQSPYFMETFKKMYETSNIELMQTKNAQVLFLS